MHRLLCLRETFETVEHFFAIFGALRKTIVNEIYVKKITKHLQQSYSKDPFRQINVL